MWYNVHKYLHQHGVAFMVKKLVNSVISVSHASSRIIAIRISATPIEPTIQGNIQKRDCWKIIESIHTNTIY